MKTDNKREILLEGLDCALCADKIEKKVQGLAGVKAASVNLATRSLVIEADDPQALPALVSQAAEIAREIEPEIRIVERPENPGALAGQRETRDRDIRDIRGERIGRWRFIGLVAGLVLFLTAFIFILPPWLKTGLYLTAYLAAGGEVIWKAIRKILRGQVFDEHFLMSVATIGALVLGELGEAAAVMLFYQAGSLLQERAVGMSRRSIGALLDIKPSYANLQAGDSLAKVNPEQIKVGDLIVIKPGERVPLDGVVREGRSLLDTSALTGEPTPRSVEIGEAVYAGSINKNGLFVMEVTREFADSAVSRILDLVQNASTRKAPTENFISQFARYYSPIVVGAAVLLAFLPPIIIPGALLADWVNRALIFLVISCPCALVISIPLGFFGGIGGASRHGILFKGSNYLEALNNVNTVIFDKTGTLTRGVFTVSHISSVSPGGEQELLELAARAESFSNHPIAQSIRHAAEQYVEDKELAGLAGFEEIPGLGVAIQWQGRRILAGSARLMAMENIVPMEPAEYGTVVHVARAGQYMGYLVISDELKADAVQAIQDLRRLGIDKLVLFTGDSQAAGEYMAGRLGLTAVHGELLPDQKVAELELLEQLKAPRDKILFVGDGINDAPVLARSDVGMAMGGLGSEAAIEAADIVLMTDEPSKVGAAIKIARRTRRIVWQNIAFAFLVKGVFLALGAAGLASMWEAVFADVGVAVIAVFNALRVLRVRL